MTILRKDMTPLDIAVNCLRNMGLHPRGQKSSKEVAVEAVMELINFRNAMENAKFICQLVITSEEDGWEARSIALHNAEMWLKKYDSLFESEKK